ncbi:MULTISPECIES: ABC transporter substrate-binding protein [unclassified Bacillus cereus group]|uniref:ABC transporter substrate-binding protein n=1 Tax=unclassified Bacillus cereus group TaxID=2750818 RepID=UPI001F55EADF|nr:MULTISPECIES: ABC transporter substrate-binding protein [unclassified Bacillus cereus group]
MLISKQKNMDVKAKEDEKVIIGILQSPKGVFNPIYFESQYDRYILNYTFEPLFTYDKYMELSIPVLATDWKFIEGYKKLYVQLRKDVLWHDNEKFTAEDVIFTYEMIASQSYKGARLYTISNIKGVYEKSKGLESSIKGIEKINDYEFIIEFTTPNSTALAKLAQISPIPKHVFEKISPQEIGKYLRTCKKPIGNGPYKFKEIKDLSCIELERNENYFLENKPFINNINIQTINKGDVLSLLKQEKVHCITSIPPEMYDELMLLENIEIKETPALSYQYLGFKVNNEKLCDIHLRKAISLCIDRDLIVRELLLNHAVVINQPIPKNCWAYNKELEKKEYYNPELAKEILFKSGYKDINHDNFLESPSGEEIVLNLDYPIGDSVRERVVLCIKNDLENIGLKVQINNPRTFDQHSQAIQNDQVEMWLSGWNMSPDPDTAVSGVWRSTDKFNYSRWINDKSDLYIEEASIGEQAMDNSVRREIYARWTELVYEEAPCVFLYSQNLIEAFNINIRGVNFDWRGGIDSRGVINWYLE